MKLTDTGLGTRSQIQKVWFHVYIKNKTKHNSSLLPIVKIVASLGGVTPGLGSEKVLGGLWFFHFGCWLHKYLLYKEVFCCPFRTGTSQNSATLLLSLKRPCSGPFFPDRCLESEGEYRRDSVWVYEWPSAVAWSMVAKMPGINYVIAFVGLEPGATKLSNSSSDCPRSYSQYVNRICHHLLKALEV